MGTDAFSFGKTKNTNPRTPGRPRPGGFEYAFGVCFQTILKMYVSIGWFLKLHIWHVFKVSGFPKGCRMPEVDDGHDDEEEAAGGGAKIRWQ